MRESSWSSVLADTYCSIIDRWFMQKQIFLIQKMSTLRGHIQKESASEMN